MTVLWLQWLAVRPRRRIALPRHLRAASRRSHTYQDPFFAEPALVEDDTRRFSR
jgi:hypothetical protein